MCQTIVWEIELGVMRSIILNLLMQKQLIQTIDTIILVYLENACYVL